MPREVMTIRLDRPLRLRLQASAKRRGVTPSAAARVALESWLAADEQAARARPFEALVDLIGSVRGRDPGRSTGGRKGVARGLKARGRGRRR